MSRKTTLSVIAWILLMLALNLFAVYLHSPPTYPVPDNPFYAFLISAIILGNIGLIIAFITMSIKS